MDLTTTILGQPMSFPVGIAPTAAHKFANDCGEKATAKGKHPDELQVVSTKPWEILQLRERIKYITMSTSNIGNLRGTSIDRYWYTQIVPVSTNTGYTSNRAIPKVHLSPHTI